MKKKVLATAALTAALALGTAVPAFAAEDASDPQPFDNDRSQSTTVSIETDKSQLSATIPIKMTVIAPVVGGNITAPSENKYVIENNSLIPIYVANIKGSAIEGSGWGLAPSVGQAPTIGTVGDISLAVNNVQVKEAGTPITDDSFKADAKNEAGTGNTLNLKVTGKTTAIKSANDDLVEAVKITYVISGTEPTPAS